MSIHYKLEHSFAHRIFLLLIIALTGLVLTYIFFLSVVFMRSGFNSAILNEHLAKLNGDVFLLRFMQILQSFFVFIIPPFILCKLYKEKPSVFLHLQMPDLQSALIAIFSAIIMIPLINVLVDWNAGMHLPEALHGVEAWMRASENEAEKITEQMTGGTTFMDLSVNIFIVGLLAGVGEELFFRGLLQSLFEKAFLNHSFTRTGKRPNWAIHLAIWTVAFIFSAIHLQFYGFIPRLLLGAWFGYLLWWSGSIWIPVLAHFTNNTLSTIFVFLKNKSLTTINPDTLGSNKSGWLCIISILLITGCIFYFMYRRKKRNS